MADLDRLIEDLIKRWDWDSSPDLRDYYINTLIPQMKEGYGSSTLHEKRVIQKIKNAATREQWRDLEQIVDQYQAGRDEAEQKKRQERLNDIRIAEEKRKKREQQEQQRRQEEEEKERQRLEMRRRAEAAEAKRRKQEQKNISLQLSNAIANSIIEADELNIKINRGGLFHYHSFRLNYLRKWFQNNFSDDVSLSDEQLLAAGEMSKAYLLKARAGSGKTKVVAAKACLLMGHEKVPPDEIMILAFNKKAADELTNRIRKQQGYLDFSNVRTFHSLAYQLVNPRQGLLFDETSGSRKKQSEFVQKLLKGVLNPALRAEIYNHYRYEMEELQDIGAFLSKEDYYTFRRAQVQETLGGEHVKSKGEKWIADFLFEHGIRYSYEKLWYWDSNDEGNYHPDFSLFVGGNSPDVIIEHWGIDEHAADRTLPEHWNITWDEYHAEMQRKRDFWIRHNQKKPNQKVLLLETSVADLREGREKFEAHLAELLRSHGIRVERLPEEKLLNEVVMSRISRFSQMCLQFIQKAKQKRLSPHRLDKLIVDTSNDNEKVDIFLSIANQIYRNYQAELETKGLIDFDDLLGAAIDTVHKTQGHCSIRLEGDRRVAMRDLKWIIIDEFQDFSMLFFDLINAIRIHNPALRLFCVGDDWQAINAFAGSDLHYFDNFTSLIRGADVGNLQNNYRSAKKIVYSGNRFMFGKGIASIPKRVNLKGRIELIHTDKVWIEQRQGDSFAEAREADLRFQTWIVKNNRKIKVDSGLQLGRVLKKCHELLTSERYNHETTFAILGRTKRVHQFLNMKEFRQRLKKTLQFDELERFGDFKERVHCGTIHSYKGLEADVVIILNVNESNFPKIHPDNQLHAIFDVTDASILSEEERLFYVAITRAKQDLYLFTETGRESEFLTRLEVMKTDIPKAARLAKSYTETSGHSFPKNHDK